MKYEPGEHKAAGEIIAKYSTNRTDIRDVIGSVIPFGVARKVLDVGCGYGFLYERLCRKPGKGLGTLVDGVRIAGIDGNPQNREPFLAAVAACGADGDFRCLKLPAGLDDPSESYDLVLSVFSLYFFPGMLPEIRRVLRPDGTFIAVTHCQDSFAELNRIIGDDRVFGALARFHDGNAAEILSPHFSVIEKVLYPNRLHFSARDAGDLERYLRFKRPDWMDGAEADRIVAAVRAFLERQDLVMAKNDVIFVCSP